MGKKSYDERNFKFETLQLHVGQEQPDPVTDARAVPIYQTSSYVFRNCDHAAARFGLTDAGNIYGRLTNPTEDVFEKRIAALEGGVAALAVASGAAAIAYTFQNLAHAGDHIVAAENIYGGTYNLFAHTLPEYGIKTTFVDPFNYEQVEAAIQENTKAIHVETLGNPNSDVVDIERLAQIAHAHKIPLVVDNTFATPYLVRPIEKGADIVVNSTSKYINANSDAISGVITDSGAFRWDKEKYPGMAEYAKFGKFAFTAKLRNGLFRNTGACLSPQTAFYNLLGMETLGLRMERACDNAKKLAEFLNTYPDVTVNYPGLSDSLWHAQAEKVLQNGYGAILTIRVGSKERAFDLINTLTIPKIVSNIGDTKTLIIHPESTLNAHSTQKEKEEAGVFDDLIRISVGIEDVEDLIEDFKHALK